MKIALALICKGTDEEAELLDRCLTNMSPHVDGIFVTRTQPNTAVGKVVNKHKGTLSDFKWVNDFAAARNFNFSQVPQEYDYIIWSDTDDMWRGLDKLRATIKSNPTVDGFGIEYLYDWDEFKRPTVVHRKTMVIKNNGCATWKGRVHEDLQETRELNIKLVKGIERLHLTNEERIVESAARNLEIAKESSEQEPDDPRSDWNLANAHLMVGNHEEAIAAFEAFLERSLSDDEKYIAYQRLSEVYNRKNNPTKAIQNLFIAIGLKPELPDAYFTLAQLYFNIGNMDKAEYYSISGLKRRPEPTKMIVFNPRDYDYNPMMLLAKVYYRKNRPDLMLPLLEGCLKIYPKDKALKKMVKEGKKDYKKLGEALEKIKELNKIKSLKRLREEIDKLPVDLRSHPAVCAINNQKFIKETSSGKDLVYYCGNTAQIWNGDTFRKEGIGGSEEAVVHLSEEWAKRGWNVTVYNNCGNKEIVSHGVTYKPFWAWNVRDKQDITILWRMPQIASMPINSDKIYVDLHDVISASEFTKERLAKIDKVFVKTPFHRSLYPNIPDKKMVVIGNGFESYGKEKKDAMLIINTSSPDRSLDVLPKLFKEIKKRVPNARLQWAYGWDGFKNGYSGNLKMMEWMNKTIEEMQSAGIESLGRLSQEDVGNLYQKASVFAYPTEFAEIDCISVKKAQAANCMPITTDFGALDTSNKFGIKIHSDKNKDNWIEPYQFTFGIKDKKMQKEWVDAVVAQLTNPKPMTVDKDWIDSFGWYNIANRWNNVFMLGAKYLSNQMIENDY